MDITKLTEMIMPGKKKKKADVKKPVKKEKMTYNEEVIKMAQDMSYKTGK